MRALNEALIERKVEARYVTLLVMLWSPAIRQFVMANAGGRRLVCRNREILKPKVEGVPLGLLATREYEEVVSRRRSGRHHGALFRRHRPITSPEGDEYGRGRLVARVEESLCGFASETVDGRSWRTWTSFERRPTFDDQTDGHEGEMIG